jgi:hypothetical protein
VYQRTQARYRRSTYARNGELFRFIEGWGDHRLAVKTTPRKDNASQDRMANQKPIGASEIPIELATAFLSEFRGLRVNLTQKLVSLLEPDRA